MKYWDTNSSKIKIILMNDKIIHVYRIGNTKWESYFIYDLKTNIVYEKLYADFKWYYHKWQYDCINNVWRNIPFNSKNSNLYTKWFKYLDDYLLV
jgi:hypothetical protein